MNTRTEQQNIQAAAGRMSTADMAHIAIFAALMAVMAQISIPMPGGVPFTMQTMGVYLTGIVLGRRKGAYAILLYLLLGLAGLPVFSHFGGGLGRLAGPTGGFLLSYPLMAWLAGTGAGFLYGVPGMQGRNETASKRAGLPGFILCMLGATGVNYAMGTLMYSAVTGNPLQAALAACVLPFIVTDLVKLGMAAVLGASLRKALHRAGLV